MRFINVHLDVMPYQEDDSVRIIGIEGVCTDLDSVLDFFCKIANPNCDVTKIPEDFNKEELSMAEPLEVVIKDFWNWYMNCELCEEELSIKEGSLQQLIILSGKLNVEYPKTVKGII